MKSTEEKAKAYDEALEKLRKFYRDYDTVSRLIDVKEELANLFPELEESEDERIRKALIFHFQDNGYLCNKEGNISNTDIVAWLEKQGEQKPDNTDFSDLRTWKYIVDAVLTEEEGVGQYLDNPFTEKVAKKLQKRFGNIEQKSVRIEEDEAMFVSLKTLLNDASCCSCTEGIDKILSWLKSLKERCAYKPSDKK